MKIDKFITIPWSDFGKMETDDLASLLKDVATKANRRLNSQNEKNIRDLDTPAYAAWKRRGEIPFGHKAVYDKKGIQIGSRHVDTSKRHETITELKRVQNFLRAKTSTVEGFEKVVAEIEGRTFGIKGKLTPLRAKRFAEGLLLMSGKELTEENIETMTDVINMFKLPLAGKLSLYWQKVREMIDEHSWESERAIVAARVSFHVDNIRKKMSGDELFDAIARYREKVKAGGKIDNKEFDNLIYDIEDYFNIGKDFSYADLYRKARGVRQKWLRSKRRKEK